MAQYISRTLPGATLHLLPSEGHFSYLYFCDECHRQILSTLFGDPLGPFDNTTVQQDTTQEEQDTDQSLANTIEQEASTANAAQE